MAINLNGQDFQGGGGQSTTFEEGTYPCTLSTIKIYKNDNFDKDALITQMDLIWDSGQMTENDKGEEVRALIYDSFITLSLNEKANLSKRLKALFGKDFDPKTAKVTLDIEGHDSAETLSHRAESKANVPRFEVNGENVFGKEALVSVEVKANGYNKVTSVSSPMKAGGVRKSAAPVGAPA